MNERAGAERGTPPRRRRSSAPIHTYDDTSLETRPRQTRRTHIQVKGTITTKTFVESPLSQQFTPFYQLNSPSESSITEIILLFQPTHHHPQCRKNYQPERRPPSRRTLLLPTRLRRSRSSSLRSPTTTSFLRSMVRNYFYYTIHFPLSPISTCT